MDIRRTSGIILILISVSLFGCKTKYKVIDSTVKKQKTEIITIIKPYHINTDKKLIVSNGKISPITLQVHTPDNIDIIAKIDSNNILKLDIIRKDSLITNKSITDITNISNDIVKIEKSTWSKIKNRIFWTSIIFNIIVIIIIALKFFI